MPRKTGFILAVVCGILTLVVALARSPDAQAAPAIFASPVQAGCYLAKPDLCKIHVDPFTINITTGTRLVQFQLTATRIGTGTQTIIYDFRTDLSNPAPLLGSTYTPSLVAKDFGVTCGQTYTLSLQGRDSGDPGLLNLGGTSQFTCPIATFRHFLPVVAR